MNGHASQALLLGDIGMQSLKRAKQLCLRQHANTYGRVLDSFILLRQ